MKYEERRKTIERVGLTEWLNSQPNGLETELKKAGLSAGESQLLAFARAFITRENFANVNIFHAFGFPK